jgi:ABC-2 type transport system permease protein
MIGTIARKEMLEMIRDGRFRWSAGITLCLLFGSVAMGWQHFRDVSAQHETARRDTRQQWLNQGEKNPHSAAHYGVYAFKPKMPLSLIDPGVDPYVGVAAWLEAHKQNEFKFKPAQDSTALARLGELTGATVLQLLIPLVIVLLTFSAFASEREMGTLRQLLSLGVKRSDLAWGKALGIAYALALLLVPATAIGVAGLALTSENGSLVQSWSRMGLMLVGYLVYFASFVGVSLAVSATAASSRVALIALLGFWIFNGLIAPKAVTDIARAMYPTPSALEFAKSMERDIENGMDGHNPADARAEALKAELLKKYNVDSVDKLPVDFNGLRMQAGEEYGNQVFDKHFTALWTTYERQRRVHEVSSFFAPALAIRSVSMGLSGTDFPQHSHFAKAAEEYRRLINREMNMDLAYNAKGKPVYMADQYLWEKIPDFHYTAPDLGWVLSHQTTSFFMLALWAGVAAIAASLAAKNVQVI